MPQTSLGELFTSVMNTVPNEATVQAKANIANPVFTGSVSLGRKANTTVGTNSMAIGNNVEASGDYSHAEGASTIASGALSHAEGVNTVASGQYAHAEGEGFSVNNQTSEYYGAQGYASHAEGGFTIASGKYAHAEGHVSQAYAGASHAEGEYTIANGYASHAQGYYTQANFANQSASGLLNTIDSRLTYPKWAANTSYAVGDRVLYDDKNNNTSVNDADYCVFECRVANNDATFNMTHWYIYDYDMGNFVEIVGNGKWTYNGTKYTENRSNARALDWNGNERLMGDLYVGCNADSTGGTKVAKISDVPDVQINGTSIVNNGIANIPIDYTQGIGINGGYLAVSSAPESEVKQAGTTRRPIVPSVQHVSTFYGLAKAAGDATQAASSNTVGTYTSEAKAAIQSMLGVPGDVQMNSTSIVSNGVADIPIMSANNYGVAKISSSLGISINEGTLYLSGANSTLIKTGTNEYRAIVPNHQHESVFYGLAKAAGSDERYSVLALGTYSADAKSAISDMLNAPETVSGTAVSITAKSGIRYECGEVVTLTITPPASGDCEFIFESGSTATVLTVNPPTGVTAVKWPDWFDAEDLEPDTIYDIIITNGRYGVVTSWT